MQSSDIRCASDFEIDQFKADGVVCLRNAISPSVVASLENSIERLSETIARSPAGYDLENLGDVAFSGEERIEYGHAKQYDLELFAGWLRYEGHSRSIDSVPAGAPKGAFLLDTGCWRRDAERSGSSSHGRCSYVTAGHVMSATPY